MGTKANPGNFDCYANAEMDEPIFILLGRDSIASLTVLDWVRRAKGVHSQEKIDEAIKCAKAMDAWHDKKKGNVHD